MNFLYAVRYFQVVAVVPPLFVAAFVATVTAAAIRLTTDPSAAVEALTPVLLLQLFAASSGYRTPARRGYYDLLLTSGIARWQIAVAHCFASIAPGIVGWISVGLLEVAASHGTRFAWASPGTCVAFLAGSLVAWALAISISRATAAVGWLLLMTIPPLTRFASPVELLGVRAAGPWPPRLISIVIVALVATAVAFRRITRAAVPLEAAQ